MKKLPKMILISASASIAAALIALFVLARMSTNGQPPGLVDGELAACPATPNCVCSEHPRDAGHFVEPIGFARSDAESAIRRLAAILPELGGVIRAERKNYLAATFASRLFGFVDDLEIRVDEQTGLIHFRSASRVGRGDGGVNRDRVEQIRARFEAAAAG